MGNNWLCFNRILVPGNRMVRLGLQECDLYTVEYGVHVQDARTQSGISGSSNGDCKKASHNVWNIDDSTVKNKAKSDYVSVWRHFHTNNGETYVCRSAQVKQIEIDGESLIPVETWSTSVIKKTSMRSTFWTVFAVAYSTNNTCANCCFCVWIFWATAGLNRNGSCPPTPTPTPTKKFHIIQHICQRPLSTNVWAAAFRVKIDCGYVHAWCISNTWQQMS